MTHKYEQEVIDLHQYFEDWFTGKLEKIEANAARLATVMAQNFHIIASDGRMTARDALLSGLFNAHATRPDFRIWIENTVVRQQIHDITIVTYEEWQSTNGTTTTRTSTVIFREDAAAPNGVGWLHVHESGLREVS
jgi:hypothetical protein